MRTRTFLSSIVAVAALAALVSGTVAQPAPKGPKAPPKPEPEKLTPPFDKSGITDWVTPPKATKEPVFKPPVAKRMKLKNGMALLVVENHKLPIASFALVVPSAGASSDPKSKYGVAAFTADLLDEGAGGLSAIAIAEETDRLGAGIGIGIDSDAAYVQVSTLAKTLDATIDLMTKVITQPAFDDKEAERVKGDRMTSLELRRDRPREVVSIMLNAALYGGTSPYGHPSNGSREDFKAVTVADARAFYKEFWNPAMMTLVVVGDVDPKAVKLKLEAGLGAWKMDGAKSMGRPIPPPAPVTNRLLLVDRKDAAQSDVRFGIIGPERKDKRYAQFEVFRTALGDGFTSRLVQRLREQLGITYGANAGMDWRLVRGPFVVGTAIVTKATGQGIEETLKIIGDLATTDLPPEELDKAKQNIIRAMPAQFGTNAGTAGAFADLVLHGLPDNWYASYAASVRKVTAKDVKAIANAVAPADKLVVAIVGDLSKIKADIDKLKLGDAVMHDLYGAPLKK